jgi:hypothetical protein
MLGKSWDVTEQKASLIQRIAHRIKNTVEHVVEKHRGFDIFTPKQYLNRIAVIPGFQ